MDVPYQAKDLILWIYLEDEGAPVTGIAFNTAGFELKVLTAGAGAYMEPTLVEGTLGTFLPNSWKELGAGVYQFCPSNTSLTPGKMTLLNFTIPGVGSYKDILNCVGVGADTATLDKQDEILVGVNAEGAITFAFNIPGFEPIKAKESVVYIKEKNRVLEFTADEDISSTPITLIFEKAGGEDVLIVEDGDLNKSGNTFTYLLPESMTEEIGVVTWGIRAGSDNLYCGRGTFTVIYAPFVDPPNPGP